MALKIVQDIEILKVPEFLQEQPKRGLLVLTCLVIL